MDEKALLEALKGGRLWGAVLDAMEVEPPSLESCGEFLSLDNVIITPHVGASTIENQRKSGKAAVTTLIEALRGNVDVPGKLV